MKNKYTIVYAEVKSPDASYSYTEVEYDYVETDDLETLLRSDKYTAPNVHVHAVFIGWCEEAPR